MVAVWRLPANAPRKMSISRLIQTTTRLNLLQRKLSRQNLWNSLQNAARTSCSCLHGLPIRHFHSSQQRQRELREYDEVFKKSIEEPEEFWAELAEEINWYKPFTKVLDNSNQPFTKWFVILVQKYIRVMKFYSNWVSWNQMDIVNRLDEKRMIRIWKKKNVLLWLFLTELAESMASWLSLVLYLIIPSVIIMMVTRTMSLSWLNWTLIFFAGLLVVRWTLVITALIDILKMEEGNE